MKKILVTIVVFFTTITVNANDRDVELNKLFLELKKIILHSPLLLSNKSGFFGALTQLMKN